MRSAIKKILGLGVVAAIVLTIVFLRFDSGNNQDAQSGSQVVTAAVRRGHLVNEINLNGKLTYGDAIAFPPNPGMLTWLPEVGSIIEVGQTVYESEGEPVTLMRGERPFWRQLSRRSTPGQDIAQLQENLADWGFYFGLADGKYEELTEAAVKDWQDSLGRETTGIFDPTRVVTANAPKIRIFEVSAHLGDKDLSAASYTLPTKEARATLREDQISQFSPGQNATVTLANGEQVNGKIKETISAPDPSQAEDNKPVLVVTVPEQDFDAQTSPEVRISLESLQPAEETLLVPAAALLATAKDHYVLEVASKDGIQRVPVEIGSAANGMVQILNSPTFDLKEGDEVVISR